MRAPRKRRFASPCASSNVGLSATKAPAGPVRFEIKNTGKLAHALAISGAGVKTRTRLIQPGKTTVLLVTFKRGAYSLWCPVPGHAAQGMKAKLLTLTQSGGGGSPATTSGGGGGGPTPRGGAPARGSTTPPQPPPAPRPSPPPPPPPPPAP